MKTVSEKVGKWVSGRGFRYSLTHLLAYSLTAFGLAGCTVTRISTEHWSIRRFSFLQRLEIPEVEFGTNGVATLHGYRSDGGNAAAAAIAEATARGAVQGMKP